MRSRTAIREGLVTINLVRKWSDVRWEALKLRDPRIIGGGTVDPRLTFSLAVAEVDILKEEPASTGVTRSARRQGVMYWGQRLDWHRASIHCVTKAVVSPVDKLVDLPFLMRRLESGFRAQ